MHNNISVQLLKRIEIHELDACKVYLEQKVSNDKQERLLFDYLISDYPLFNEQKLETERVLNDLFGKEDTPQQRKNLQNIGYKLSILIKDFLIEQELQNDEQLKEFLLAMAYIRLGYQDLLDKLINGYYEKILSKQPEKSIKFTPEKVPSNGFNIWHNWHLHRLHYLRYYSRSTVKTASSENSLEDSLQHLNLAHLAAKLRIAHEMETLKNINGREPVSIFSPEELHTIHQQLGQYNSYIKLYFYAYELAVNMDDKSYYALKQLFRETSTYLSKDDCGNLLNALINYTSFAIKKGKDVFYAEALDLLKEGLDTTLLLQDNQISPETLISVVNTACEAKQFEEAEQLIKKWQTHLPIMRKNEGLALANARLLLYVKKFDQIAEHLSPRLTFLDKHLELSAKTTQIQANYEQKNWLSFESNCESLKVMLRRAENRYSDPHKASYGNFIKMAKSLQLAQEKKRKEKLEERLKSYGQIVCKSWLFEKIMELKA